MKAGIIVAAASGLLLLGATACQEEGPAERAGKQMDEAVKDVSSGAEGALEKLGREVDEAVKETGEAAREIEDAAKKAAE